MVIRVNLLIEFLIHKLSIFPDDIYMLNPKVLNKVFKTKQ